MRASLGFALCCGLLTACAGKPVEPGKVYVPAKVAVAVGCVVDRPVKPVALKDRIPGDQWAMLAPGARARAVEGQAGARLNYEDALAAATAGCRDAP